MSPARLKVLIILGLFVIGLLPLRTPSSTFAGANCAVSFSPNQASVGEDVTFSFHLDVVDGQISWFRINRPSTGVTITDGSAFWQVIELAPDHITFGNGSIGGGGSTNVYVMAHIDSFSDPGSWTAQGDADSSGSSPSPCTGDLTTTFMDTTPVVISSLNTSIEDSSSASVSWQTNKPSNSVINYGTSTSYGQNLSDDTQSVSHSLKLTNLSPRTNYHYQISSTDVNSNSATSGDNTFLTPEATIPIHVSTPAPTVSPNPSSGAEKVPPTVSLSSKFLTPVKEAPTIEGTASDNTVVEKVEYSTDGGKNWLKVKVNSGKSVSFSFSPLNLTDGSYSILARASDLAGNIGVSSPVSVIIDQLPPVAGVNIISSGSQILSPDKDGVITTTTGVDLNLSTVAVGGPSKITISTKTPSSKDQVFGLSYSMDSNLWKGVLSFRDPGVYVLSVHSEDDAGNKLDRKINTINVQPPSQLVGSQNRELLKNAEVTVFYLEHNSNTWQIWDGTAFSEVNPQSTDKYGRFSLMLPSGKYYLRFSAPGYKTTYTQVMQFSKPTSILTSVSLSKSIGIHLGPINFDLPFSDEINITAVQKTKLPMGDLVSDDLNSKPLPSFTLPETSGADLASINLLGKPSILTFLSTWSPNFSDQLSALEELQKNEAINVVTITNLESLTKVRTQLALSSHPLPVAVDPGGALIDKFHLYSEPTHFFVTRKGVIKGSVIGVLSRSELESHLEGL